eukprot:scaffold35885_cov18-Prasinocladus_malaysianus.AAC.1
MSSKKLSLMSFQNDIQLHTPANLKLNSADHRFAQHCHSMFIKVGDDHYQLAVIYTLQRAATLCTFNSIYSNMSNFAG